MGSPVFHNNSLFILITPFLSMIFLKKLCVAKSYVVSRKQIITISEFVECQLVIPWDYVIYVRYAQDKPILSSGFPAKGLAYVLLTSVTFQFLKVNRNILTVISNA